MKILISIIAMIILLSGCSTLNPGRKRMNSRKAFENGILQTKRSPLKEALMDKKTIIPAIAAGVFAIFDFVSLRLLIEIIDLKEPFV